ncbi:LEPR-XLL domain-containing protein [Mucisphaera sp.]|uniref:golvesin C-terminal-like domain-containing protein n=1 Tax=Mucisphaera sp. TaxID=2913024 RepID=UPI003D0A475F
MQVVRTTPAQPARLETLEDRVLLSGSPTTDVWEQPIEQTLLTQGVLQIDNSLTIELAEADTSQLPVPVGQQPEGALSGKIVYVHAGHGFTWTNNSFWTTQRGEGFELVEDLGNIDQMNFLIDQLWNAGATIVPLRPAQHQLNEVVLDNVDPEVTFVGNWSNSSQTVYYGEAGEVPYRFASTSSTETAYARYRPDIPEAGYYPVYTFVLAGSDRVDQLYRVHHTGGITEVSIDHTKVGTGWVYLGNFYFNEGTDGYVDISNRNDDSGVVIADAIRFGNGMGDIERGGTTSGRSREDEAGLYWVERLVNDSQGIPTSEYRTASDDRDATVSLAPRWAEFMNREASGSLQDRVFLSFHSNAGGGRGAVGLHNTSSGGDTPNQFLWADLTGAAINDDFQAIGTPQLEHLWSNRSTDTFQASFNYGEISNFRINNEFDATIIEVAFHDNQLDTELLRDPEVRQWVARSQVHAMIQYFDQVGTVASTVEAPEAVTNVAATTNSAGEVTISWNQGPSGGVNGDAPTGYLVQTSFDGYGFDGGLYVDGNANTSLTLTNLNPANGVHYFRVLAVNDGGVSLDSAVVAANPGQTDDSAILIVNGFDRYDRSLNVREQFIGAAVVDRVRPQWMNTFDYTIQHADAVHAFDSTIGFDTVQNEAVISGQVDLTQYTTVIWVLGEESSVDATFNSTEQTLVTNYVNAGGNLFLSGSEIGWDLDALGNGNAFFNNVLRADYVADDANTQTASGVSGSIFAGISLTFDDGDVVYDVNSPDVIATTGLSEAALTYSTGGVAAITSEAVLGGQGGIVLLAFPFESIIDQADRHDIMAAALNFLGADPVDRPDSPTGIAAESFPNEIVLTWTAPADPTIVGYHVERRDTPAGDFVRLTSGQPLTYPVYLDTNVTTGVDYTYRVVAIDALDVQSLPTGEANATPTELVQLVDDIETVFTNDLFGTWSVLAGVGLDGSDAHIATPTENTFATWTFDIPSQADYEIEVFIPESVSGLLGTAEYRFQSTAGLQVINLNQSNPTPGGWTSIGTHNIDAGELLLILDASVSLPGDVVLADGIRLTEVTEIPSENPPVITEIVVGSTSWSSAFLNDIDPGRALGYSMPTGIDQLDALPWDNMDQFSLVFSEDVFLTGDAFLSSQDGFFTSGIVPTSFTYDSVTFTATWTLPVNIADNIGEFAISQFESILDTQGVELDGEWTLAVSEVSGDGSPGGFFNYFFRTVRADTNGDGAVDLIDLSNLASSFNASNTQTDFNGDNVVDLIDLSILASNFGTDLSEPEMAPASVIIEPASTPEANSTAQQWAESRRSTTTLTLSDNDLNPDDDAEDDAYAPFGLWDGTTTA